MKLPSVIIPTKSVFVELCSKNTLSTKFSSIFDSIGKIGTYSKSFFQNGINILPASAVVRNNHYRLTKRCRPGPILSTVTRSKVVVGKQIRVKKIGHCMPCWLGSQLSGPYVGMPMFFIHSSASSRPLRQAPSNVPRRCSS